MCEVNESFFDLPIKTFVLEDLVGRRVDILGFENEDGKVILAKDIKTGEGFLLACEPAGE